MSSNDLGGYTFRRDAPRHNLDFMGKVNHQHGCLIDWLIDCLHDGRQRTCLQLHFEVENCKFATLKFQLNVHHLHVHMSCQGRQTRRASIFARDHQQRTLLLSPKNEWTVGSAGNLWKRIRMTHTPGVSCISVARLLGAGVCLNWSGCFAVMAVFAKMVPSNPCKCYLLVAVTINASLIFIVGVQKTSCILSHLGRSCTGLAQNVVGVDHLSGAFRRLMLWRATDQVSCEGAQIVEAGQDLVFTLKTRALSSRFSKV